MPSMACKGSRLGSALPCPAGRSVPGRGGPERRRRPRPDGTAPSVRPGSVAHRDHRGTSGHLRAPTAKRNHRSASLQVRQLAQRGQADQIVVPKAVAATSVHTRESEGSFHSAAECRVVKLDLGQLLAFRGVEHNPNRDAVAWVDPFEERL
jgi:hypothetical protein